MLAALEDIAKILPFPLLGIDSEGGSEFINHHLLHWCEQRKITFTRSRPGNSNDGAHVEQKNWAVVRTVVGIHPGVLAEIDVSSGSGQARSELPFGAPPADGSARLRVRGRTGSGDAVITSVA